MPRTPLAATTVREALESAVIALTAAGVATPRLDAEVLLAHVLGVDRAALITAPARELTPAQARAFMDAARRRREREPVAYITGWKGFRMLDLAVDRRVLIPRPETEHVVEAALGLAAGTRVVDVGTGSGAIALALKSERPDLEVFATDVSPDALAVARGNAERLGLDVTFVEGDLLAGVEADAVVAAGDGLDVIRRLVTAPVAFMALEMAGHQGDAVESLLRGAGFASVERVRDLAGIERVMVARR
jgi:release factor glutamine methyltransferase